MVDENIISRPGGWYRLEGMVAASIAWRYR